MARAQRKRKTTGRGSGRKSTAVRTNTARKKNIAKRSSSKKHQGRMEGVSFLFFTVSVLLLISLLSKFNSYYLGEVSSEYNLLGRFGDAVSSRLFEQVGFASLIAPLWFFKLASYFWKGPSLISEEDKHKYFGSFIASIFLLCFSSLIFTQAIDFFAGGRLGSRLSLLFEDYFGQFGAVLISTLATLFFFSLTFGFSLSSILSPAKNTISPSILTFFKNTVFNIFSDIFYFILSTIKFIYSGFISLFTFSNNDLSSNNSSFSGELKGKPPSISNKRNNKRNKSSAHKTYTLGDSELEYVDTSYDEFEDLSFSGVNHEDESLGESLHDDFSLDDSSQIKISRGLLEDGAEEVKTGLWGKFSKNKAKKTLDSKKSLEKSGENSLLLKRGASPDYPDYEFPATKILIKGGEDFYDGPEDKILHENSHLLERALKDFKIGGKVTEVHPGPVITLYQFHPAAGVKVQRIINLADDLALALKAPRVRVYAPVPGKGAVGIEVPNTERQIVRLRDILESDESWNSSSPLELAMGKDTFGEPVVADLAKMPHLLIAGATGTGKSVCINSILMSLLYRNTPEDMRLLLIDPKMLELTVYEGIPHLKAPVVTNPKHARGLLWWAVEEMESRYKVMMKLGVRSLDNYNQAVSAGESALKRKSRKKKNTVIELQEQHVVSTSTDEGLDRERDSSAESLKKESESDIQSNYLDNLNTEDLEPLPRIVIVVDELADLMLTVGRDIEELLTRLAQKARAAGIHLIIATQRPSVNVITGLIKANFPSRISFQVASKIDSRTVIDMSGAEKLLGQGDMLFLPPGTGRLRRLHSPFVSDSEVRDVIAHIREQGEADYDPAISSVIQRMEESESSSDISAADGQEYDPLHDKAVALVIERGQASTSMVQRAFRIGYNRAARILDVMEAEGIVGPSAGAKARKVLVGGAQD